MTDSLEIGIDQILAARDHANAQRDAALAMVRQLLALIRSDKGYRRHSEQVLMREAAAMLAEAGET